MEDIGTVIKDNTVKESDMEQKLQARAAQLAASMRVSENISPSVIASWQDQVKNLLELANSAGISIDIASLQAQLASVESEMSFEKSKAILELYSPDNKLSSEEDQENIKKMDDFRKEGLRLENDHQKIMADVDKYIEKKKKETQELSDIADLIDEKNKKGEDIDPSILKPLIQSPEQIRAQILEEIEHEKKFRQHKKAVDDHNKAIHTHNNDLKTKKAKSVEQDSKAPKQIADFAELVKINNEKTEKIKLYDQQIKESDIEVKKFDKQKEELEQATRKLEKIKERRRAAIANVKKAADKIRSDLARENILLDCDKLLSQEEMINNEVFKGETILKESTYDNKLSKDEDNLRSDNVGLREVRKVTPEEKAANLVNQMRGTLMKLGENKTDNTNKIADPTPIKKNVRVSKSTTPSLN